MGEKKCEDGTLKQNYQLQKETWRKERADKGANELAKFRRLEGKNTVGQIRREKYRSQLVTDKTHKSSILPGSDKKEDEISMRAGYDFEARYQTSDVLLSSAASACKRQNGHIHQDKSGQIEKEIITNHLSTKSDKTDSICKM